MVPTLPAFMAIALYELEPLFHLLKAAGCFSPPCPFSLSSPWCILGGAVSVRVLLLFLAREASQPCAEQHRSGGPCSRAVVGPADFTLAWRSKRGEKAGASGWFFRGLRDFSQCVCSLCSKVLQKYLLYVWCTQPSGRKVHAESSLQTEESLCISERPQGPRFRPPVATGLVTKRKKGSNQDRRDEELLILI